MLKFPIYKLRISDDDNSGVDFVALVDSPAIEKNFMAFDEDKELFQVKDKEQRIVSGALMVANLPIYRRDEQHGEYYVVFDKETISNIVHKFFKRKNTTNINLMHDPNRKVEDIYMFESFIIDRAKGINPPLGFEKLADGSWFGSFKVNNDQVWEQIKGGEFKGFSVEGVFEHEFLNDSDSHLIESVRNVLLNSNNTNVIYIKPNDMKFDIDEKIKSKIEAIKALFNEEVKMTDAKLADGTIVSYEGETPIAGVKIFVVDETGKNPAPDGTHELADGTLLETKDGVILNVTAKVEEEVETVAEVAPVENSEVTELKKANEVLASAVAELKASSEKQVAEFKAEVVKLSESNKQLFALVQELVNIPEATPVQRPATPFATNKDKTQRLIELSKNLQTIKK